MATPAEQPSTRFCPRCSVEIPGDSAACPHCLLDLRQAGGEMPQRNSLYQHLDKPWIMLAVLFLVTAGFGIPFLWQSRAFGTFGKVVLTIIMIAYTALILWLIGLLVIQIMDQLAELRRSW